MRITTVRSSADTNSFQLRKNELCDRVNDSNSSLADGLEHLEVSRA